MIAMRNIRDMIAMRLLSLLGLVGLLALAGCSNEEDDIQQQSQGTQQKLTLVTSLTPFYEVNRMSTRALPDGYVPYNVLYPTTVPEKTTIGVFMPPERITPSVDFVYKNANEWESTIGITNGTQYYIYGFMPKEDTQNATIAPLNSDYANGATLNITGLNTVTGADVCLIVGVKKWEPTPGNATAPAIEDSGIRLGEFGYAGGPEGSNYVYLLLKHIYAGLHFKAHVDPVYAALRTIRVKKFEILSDALADAIDLTIEMTANTEGRDPVTSIRYAPSQGANTLASATLFPYEGSPAEVVIPVSSPEGFLACYAPSICNSFILQTTFDVYDKQGNKTRENCVVQNLINNSLIPQITSMTAGELYTIDMLIKPTYLYVLSDPDLDNPTVTLTTTTNP